MICDFVNGNDCSNQSKNHSIETLHNNTEMVLKNGQIHVETNNRFNVQCQWRACVQCTFIFNWLNSQDSTASESAACAIQALSPTEFGARNSINRCVNEHGLVSSQKLILSEHCSENFLANNVGSSCILRTDVCVTQAKLYGLSICVKVVRVLQTVNAQCTSRLISSLQPKPKSKQLGSRSHVILIKSCQTRIHVAILIKILHWFPGNWHTIHTLYVLLSECKQTLWL